MSFIGVTGEVSESKLFEWKITDFFALSAKKGSFYDSPSFVVNNTSFHLRIYPEGDLDTESGSISLFLKNESDCPAHVAFKFHIKNANGSLIAGMGINGITFRPSNFWGYPNFYKRSYLFRDRSKLVPSDILTIACVLKFVKDGKEVPVKADNVKALHQVQAKILDCQRLIDLEALSENLKNLSAYKESCDVVLQVEDKEFKAHKIILMARSPVFAGMFRHDTVEKVTGFVNIPDCDSESFQKFLDFLYCGKLEDVSFRSAFHLYCTAHKYEVLKLKEFCTQYLTKSLTIDNMCDIVELADKYDETLLITETQKFFNENLCRIFLTSEWQKLLTNNPRLTNKLLTEYAKAKGSQ